MAAHEWDPEYKKHPFIYRLLFVTYNRVHIQVTVCYCLLPFVYIVLPAARIMLGVSYIQAFLIFRSLL